MARIDPRKPAVLTREIVRDVAGAEGYYRTGLQDGVATEAPVANVGVVWYGG